MIYLELTEADFALIESIVEAWAKSVEETGKDHTGVPISIMRAQDARDALLQNESEPPLDVYFETLLDQIDSEGIFDKIGDPERVLQYALENMSVRDVLEEIDNNDIAEYYKNEIRKR